MLTTMRWFLVFTAMGSGLCGCKSGPTWDWWRMSRAGTPESSPIARSAGPPLPSELAQQGDPSLASGNLQVPVVDPGGDAMGYGGQAPAYNTTVSVTNPNYPSTGAGYGGSAAPSQGSMATGNTAGSYPSGNTTDPFSRGTAGSGSSGIGTAGAAQVQNGYYDPNAIAGSTVPSAGPSSANQADRYAYNPSTYGGTSPTGTGGSGGLTTATQWPPQSASSNSTAGTGYQPSAATAPEYGTSNPSYGSANPPQSATAYGGAAGAPVYPDTSSGGNGRYGSTPMGGNVQVSQVDFGESTPPSNATAGYDASGIASAAPVTVPAHYRPGGTSDYEGPGGSPYVNVATRPEAQEAAPSTTNSSVPDAPTYRYGAETPYGESGIGQRY